MSRPKARAIDPSSFAGRLVEMCGSAEPAKIKRSLNISYQAAKNYLSGRLPNAEVLLAIASMTPYSIHWLLTGEGPKLVAGKVPPRTPPASGHFNEKVRKVCVEVINEMNGSQEPDHPKIVVLQPGDVLSEEPVSELADLQKRPL